MPYYKCHVKFISESIEYIEADNIKKVKKIFLKKFNDNIIDLQIDIISTESKEGKI